MAERQTAVIPLLHGVQIADPALARAIEQLRRETQHYLVLLTERLDQLQGLRGIPTFHADVDAGGNRLRNVAVPVTGSDAQRADRTISLTSAGVFDAGDKRIVNVSRAMATGNAVPLEQLPESITTELSNYSATTTPLEVESVGSAGVITNKFSRADHVHVGINLGDAQTLTGLKTFDRDPAAPFAVTAGSAKVTNLDADLLDGIDSAGFVQITGAQTVAGAKTWSDLATFNGGLRFGTNETIDLYDEATFTATGTGFTVNPTGTARYVILEKSVLLFLPELTGTSNATTFTITGLPAAIQPTQTSWHPVRITDNSVDAFGLLRLNAASGTIDLFSTAAAGAWAAANTKTLHAAWVAYGLL